MEKTFAEKCREGGGKFLRGSSGDADAATYFAFTPRECEWKAEVKDAWPDVVVLEVLVWKGKSKRIEYHAKETITFQSLVVEGYDSVLLDRNCVKKTGDQIPGNEVAVYSWDQVRVLRLVDRDPVPRGIEG